MKRQPWSVGRMAVVVFCLIVGLIFFWLGVGIWIIPVAGLVGFVSQVI
jgi:hypothetical protein